MKEKTYGLRTSLVLLVVSVILTGIFQFEILNVNENTKVFFVTVFGGAVSSALVTFLIYLFEYRAVKTKILEEYWQLQLNLINKFLALKYFYPPVPVNLIIRRFEEIQHNKVVDENRIRIQDWKNFSELDGFKYHTQAREEWIQYLMKEDVQEDVQGDANLYEMYASQSDKQFEEILEKIDDVMDSYIMLAKEKYSEIEKVSGDICFFSDFGKRKWKQIYEKIHNPIREMLRTVRVESFHIKLYRNGAKNFAVALKKMLEIQESFTKLERSSNNGYNGIIVYADFYDRMDRELENFRAKVIYKQEPEYKERTCIFESIDLRKK